MRCLPFADASIVPTESALADRCRKGSRSHSLMAPSGYFRTSTRDECPLLGVKRTLRERTVMSANDP
jgi:hypothetical protein